MTDSIPPTERPPGFPGDPLLDIQRIRTAIAEDARAAIGTGSTGPAERQDAYAARLFPGTASRLAAQMADAMYSCALNYRAACRAAGVDFPELGEDYSKHIGAAPAEVEKTARRFGAYLSAREIAEGSYVPDAGDAIIVDAPWHCIVIVERVDATGNAYLTSEGGMPEVDPKTGEHGMCIHSRTMALRVVGSRVQTGTLDRATGVVTWGRWMLYAVRADFLLERE